MEVKQEVPELFLFVKLGEKNMEIYPHTINNNHIYSAIRQSIPLTRMTTNNEISPMKFCSNTSFTFPNNPKDLDPSYKMDLDFLIVLEGKKLSLVTKEIQY